MHAPRLALFAPLFVLFVLAGCGGGDDATKPIVPADGLPAGTPQADSPAHLAARLEATWESQVEAEYAKLLTDDFRFHFSLANDPVLVDHYGDNWRRDDEVAALTHLFDGFTNTSGDPIPGATEIELTMNGMVAQDDSSHADSTAHYRKLVVTTFGGTIEIPGTPESVLYSLSSRQELYLVRGDAAVLPAGTTPDSTRWYVRGWDDQIGRAHV